MNSQAVHETKPFESIQTGGRTMIVVGEMTKVERRKLLETLPVDLRERVQRRVMTVEQARAWVRLRDAFHGDVETLNSTLLTAYGVA